MSSLFRLAIPVFALAACATSKQSAPPSQAPAQAPAAQHEGQPSAAPAKAEPPSGPTTASEAAEQVHEEWVKKHGGRPGGAGGDAARTAAEDGPCSTDDQCALTRVPEGGCCETLCVPRAVTRGRADALGKDDRACLHGKMCPDVSCHPLGQQVEAKCDARRCVARQIPGGGQ